MTNLPVNMWMTQTILYELIEAFLLDLQHAGMKQGNETYIAATKQATKMREPLHSWNSAVSLILMIGLITTNSPWLFLLISSFQQRPSLY